MAGQQRMAVRRRGSAVVIAAFAALMMAGFLGPASPAAAQGAVTMKLSTATLNDTQHEWLKRFAAAVEKDSGGRIKAEIYPASQLGAIPRQIEGVQFASIQGWTGPPEFLVGVDERYEALSAPGLFTSRAQYERTVKDPAVTLDGARLAFAQFRRQNGHSGVIQVRKPAKRLRCRDPQRRGSHLFAAGSGSPGRRGGRFVRVKRAGGGHRGA